MDSDKSKKNQIFKFNTILGNTYYILLICILGYLFTLLFLNYFLSLFKLFTNMNYYLQDNNIYQVISFKNLFNFKNIIRYPVIYLAHLIICFIFSIKVFIKHKMAFIDMNEGQKGTRRWATEEEIKEQYKAIEEKPYDENGNLNEYEGKAGYPIARIGSKLYINTEILHPLIVGTTGSGKGQCFVLPTIDTFSRVKEVQNGKKYFKPSMIVPDPKLENYASSGDELKKRGYKVLILNLLDLNKSMNYNPLDIVTKYYIQGDIEKAQEQAKIIASSLYNNSREKTSDPFWNEQAEKYCTALILAHTEDCCESGHPEKNNMYSLAQTHNYLNAETVEIDNDEVSYLDIYFTHRSNESTAKSLYLSGFKNVPDQTKQTIFTNVTKELSGFLLESTAKMTSSSSIDFDEFGFGENPIALFLGFDETNKANHKLMSMFIGQLYTQLSHAALLRSTDGACKRSVRFLMDEWGNVPPIDDIVGKVTLARGKNIQFLFVLQSYAQLDKDYGKEVGSIIKDNISTQIYILTNGLETAQYFSKLVGNYTYEESTRSGALFSTNKTVTEGNSSQKPLINENELMELQMGETIVARTEPRKTLQGKDCIPYPIRNKDENRFHYAYTYLHCFKKKDYQNLDNTDNETIDLNKLRFNAIDYVETIKKIMDITNENKTDNFLINIFKNEEIPFYKEYMILDNKLNNFSNFEDRNLLENDKDRLNILAKKIEQYPFDYKKYTPKYILKKLCERYEMNFDDFINEVSLYKDFKEYIEKKESILTSNHVNDKNINKEKNINNNNHFNSKIEFKKRNIKLLKKIADILFIDISTLLDNRNNLEEFIEEKDLLYSLDYTQKEYVLNLIRKLK